MRDNEEEKFEKRLPCVLEAIGALKCKKKIQLCNSWVSRLQRSDPDEYELRNQYLFLLWKQVNDRHLDDPFLTCPPCYGKLAQLENQGNECCSSGRKGSCCKSSKCQRNGCTRDTCCANKSRSVPDIPQNPLIPDIRMNATMSNGSQSNIPSPSATETQASTSHDTSVGMFQETPHSQETCEESPGETSQGTPSKEPYRISPQGDREDRTPGEVLCGMSQLATPCVADYATPTGNEGSTLRVRTTPAPPQFGSQFRNCQTDMRNFYELMGGSGNRNALPESLSCSASTPNPLPDARRRLNISHEKCDSQHDSQYLLISEETPSETPQESARNSRNRNSPVNRRCFQPTLLDNAFKRRLAEMNFIYNVRMKTLDEKEKNADCMNNILKSQVRQVKVQLTTQIRADEQMLRCLQEENRTLKAKIQVQLTLVDELADRHQVRCQGSKH